MSTAPAVVHEIPDHDVEPPQVTERTGEPHVRFVLPLLWSLHYALTDGQWKKLRERHKQRFPDWEHCTCPKRCKTKVLDEQWRYDVANHTKVFTGAAFICHGCHWLKSRGWRIQTWLQQAAGQLRPQIEPPHIISCLGWTQAKVDALRLFDMMQHQGDVSRISQIQQQVQMGQAAMVPTPIERLAPDELARRVSRGQVMIVPWRVDLSALSEYGYTAEEIAVFEERMYRAAAQRMDGKKGVGKVPNKE